MKRPGPSPEQRAARLLQWYPAAWRARYGLEFEELLIDDLTEHAGSWWHSAGVVRSGLLTRVRMVVPGAYALEPTVPTRAALAVVGVVGILALIVGAAMWSQLAVGWAWAAPTSPAASGGLIGMSAGVILLLAWAVGRLAPAIRDAIGPQRRHDGARRVSAFLVSVSVLVVAGRHFANSWPGTGGTHGHEWSLVPGGVAAFVWACTWWISSYWAHPASLSRFPASQLAWMVLGPVALARTILTARRLVQHRTLSSARLRYESRLSLVALGGIVLVVLAD